jgi:hypothetical protein
MTRKKGKNHREAKSPEKTRPETSVENKAPVADTTTSPIKTEMLVEEQAPSTPKTKPFTPDKNTPRSIITNLTNLFSQQTPDERNVSTNLSKTFSQQNDSIEESLEKQLQLIQDTMIEPSSAIDELLSKVNSQFEKQSELGTDLRLFVEQERVRGAKMMEEIKVVHDLLQHTDKLNKELTTKCERLELAKERELNRVTIVTDADERNGASWYLVVALTFIVTVCIVTIISNYSSRRTSIYAFPPS